MIESFKSWWYWNVSSKFDALDLFVYIFYPVLVGLILLMMVNESRERKEFSVACESKGGIVVKGVNRTYECLEKKVIL